MSVGAVVGRLEDDRGVVLDMHDVASALERFRLEARVGTRQLLSVQGSDRLQGFSGVWDLDVWTEDGEAPAFTRSDFFFDPR